MNCAIVSWSRTDTALSNFGVSAGTLHRRFEETAGEAIAAIGTHGDRLNESVAMRLGTFEATVLQPGSRSGGLACGSDRPVGG